MLGFGSFTCRCSLSPRERAGVRGKGPPSCPAFSIQSTASSNLGVGAPQSVHGKRTKHFCFRRGGWDGVVSAKYNLSPATIQAAVNLKIRGLHTLFSCRVRAAWSKTVIELNL